MAEPVSAEERKLESERRSVQESEWNARAAALPADDEVLTSYSAQCRTALDDEGQRQQSIDARLTTIIGLSSIAATVVFGTMLTAVPRALSVSSLSLVILPLWYVILQLVCAMLAGVRGLERRGYDAMPPTELLPADDEGSTDHHRRQIQQFFACFVQNQDQNNTKLTQLAVAHCALKNFIGGLVIFAILAGIHRVVERPSDELVNRLKADHVLRELLRGPQGEPGRVGPQGPPGVAGPKGPAGVPPLVPTTTRRAQSP